MLLILLATFAAARAAVFIPASLIQTPNSRANVLGPDGTAVLAPPPPGAVLTDGNAAYAPVPVPAFFAAYNGAPVAFVAPPDPARYFPDSFEEFYDDGPYDGQTK